MSKGIKIKTDAEKATPALLKAAQKDLPPEVLEQIDSDIGAMDHTAEGHLGKVGPYNAYAMNFGTLRLHHDTDEGEGLVDGANFKATPKVVPKGRVYVDSALAEERRPSVLTHEAVETHLMDKANWPYEKAHPVANHFEQQALRKTQSAKPPMPQMTMAGLLPQIGKG